MKVKFVIVGEYGFAENRAEIEHNGIEITIKKPLPDDLRAKVEAFYIEEARQQLGISLQ